MTDAYYGGASHNRPTRLTDDSAAGGYVGRKLAPGLVAAETAVFNGGSAWAAYWTDTVVELRDKLVQSTELDDQLVDRFLVHCADPAWWTQTIAFTAVQARAPCA